jgi:hypothetical protein
MTKVKKAWGHGSSGRVLEAWRSKEQNETQTQTHTHTHTHTHTNFFPFPLLHDPGSNLGLVICHLISLELEESQFSLV